MYANFIVKSKIKFVCNADGPGLLDKQFNSYRFKEIKDKYIHVIPETSYIGLFLNHTNDKIVKTSSKGLLSHAANYWLVEDDKFIEVESLNTMSKSLDEKLKNWLIKYNNQDKFNFVSNLDILLRKANVSSALELVSKNTKIFRLLRESKDMDEETKRIIRELLNIVISCYKTAKKEELSELFNNVFKNKQNNTNEQGV